jgi:hypothetical protein
MIEYGPTSPWWVVEAWRTAPERVRLADIFRAERGVRPNLLLRVERFALSANNITYALEGDALGYWSLFPAQGGWGRIPAWGDGVVVESDLPGIARGSRWSGLMPMAPFIEMQAQPRGSGFSEVSAHRRALNPVYNHYRPVAERSTDQRRDLDLSLRPLLAASYVLAETLSAPALHGAATVIALSASSRTALGTAMLLKGRMPLLGLTSPRNRAFVEGTGLYDSVATYAQWPAPGSTRDCIVLDFAGNAALEQTVRERIGSRLTRYIRIGSTHREGAAAMRDARDLFFAPAAIAQLIADRGAASFDESLTETIDRFAEIASPWLEWAYLDAPEAVCKALAQLSRGQVAPQRMLIARPNPATRREQADADRVAG